MHTPTISMVIPTLNAEPDLPGLLEALSRQTTKLDEIVVVDSSSQDRTCEIANSYPNVRVIEIEKSSFNHGGTRDMAFRATTGEFVCFMTQDALPKDDHYIENLITPMVEDSTIGLVTGRQLPKSDARRFEQLVREYNYPSVSNVRTIGDLSRLGVKAYFASDVCSAYRRSMYFAVGGFDAVETNEDMLLASKLLHAGYKVAYAADAEVFHSHNLTFAEQFKRNRAVGSFLASHQEELEIPDEVGEDGRLFKEVFRQLMQERRFGEAFAFILDCAARFTGNRAGR